MLPCVWGLHTRPTILMERGKVLEGLQEKSTVLAIVPYNFLPQTFHLVRLASSPLALLETHFASRQYSGELICSLVKIWRCQWSKPGCLNSSTERGE